MKKKVILFLIISIIVLGCSNDDVDESSNINTGNNQENVYNNEYDYMVTLHLFGNETCPFCIDQLRWLDSIRYSHPHLVYYYHEVSENRELYQRVRDEFGITNTGVPLTIIGNYVYIGFNETRSRRFLRDISSLASRENCDVVATIIANGDVAACREQNEN